MTATPNDVAVIIICTVYLTIATAYCIHQIRKGN